MHLCVVYKTLVRILSQMTQKLERWFYMILEISKILLYHST